MLNVMAARPNIGGALCSTQVWLAPTVRLPCSNAANKTAQDLEDTMHLAKFRYGATAAEMYM